MLNESAATFLSAFGATSITIITVHPLFKANVRQQIENSKFIPSLKSVLNDNLRGVYRGIMPALLNRSLVMALNQTVYGEIRRYCEKKSQTKELTLIISTVISSTTESLVCTPFERIQMLMMQRNTNYRNALHAIRGIYRHFGVLRFYDGLSIIVCRNFFGSFVYYGVRDFTSKSKRSLLTYDNSIQSFFLSGIITGSCVSLILHPVKLLQYNYQSRLVDSNQKKSPLNFFRQQIVGKRGYFMGVYRGSGASILRLSFSFGIFNASLFLLRTIFD
ncbi:MAG: hypothetical protein MHMPM18_003458 [Marteilia pararefringens]